MLQIDIYNIKQFKCFFDVVSDIADSIELQFKKNDGVYCSVLSKNHTQFFNVFFDEAFFDEYSVSANESFVVDAAEFYNILDAGNNNDNLMIYAEDNLIKCTFCNNYATRVFKLIPVDKDYSSNTIPPSIDFHTKVSVGINVLKPIIDDVYKIIGSEQLYFKIVQQNFNITSGMNDDYIHRFHNASIEGDDAKAQYSLPYIKKLLKFKEIDENIFFEFGNDLPLRYEINSTDELVKVTGLIAPRIDANV